MHLHTPKYYFREILERGNIKYISKVKWEEKFKQFVHSNVSDKPKYSFILKLEALTKLKAH